LPPPDVIIPAHNEASTIAAVIAAARTSGAVGRIIVVVDASTDATRTAAGQADVVTTSLAADKGSAVAAGLFHVTSEATLLLDADLTGLQPAHVAALATRPPLTGQVVGLRSDKGWAGGLPSLSGERRLPTYVLESINPRGKGWALETIINARIGALGLPWRHLRLVGVENPSKATTDPLDWAYEFATVGLASAVELPGLIDYTLHPDGRSPRVRDALRLTM
jgi:glycosyltransferase involved in cell wall biosynthesis